MKFIGQFIQNFIARFRSDVYLENIESGTIASGGNLGLDSNNKIVKASETEGDITRVSIITDTGGSGGQIDSGNADYRILGGTGASVTNSGTTITVASEDSEIDHDSLSNFVAEEHVDWAGASAGTIHSTNIPTLNQDTTGSAAVSTNASISAANSTDGTHYITFVDGATGTQGLETDTALSYVPLTNLLTAGGFIGDGSGLTGLASDNIAASTSNALGIGSIELGHASDTTLSRSAAGTLAVEGKNVRTEEKVLHIKQGSFTDDCGTDRVYFPMAGTVENTASVGVTIPFLAPVGGKLLKLHWRTNKDHSGQTTTFALANWDPGDAFTSGNAADLGTKAVTPSNQNNVTTIDFQTGVTGTNAFSAGDTLAISMQNSSAVNSGSSTKYWFAAVFEFDFSSY